MEKDFNPTSYRKLILENARQDASFYDEEIEKKNHKIAEFNSEEKESKEYAWAKSELEWAKRKKQNAFRYSVKIARWNEPYWHARMLKTGKYQNGDNETLVDIKTGLTAAQLAEKHKLIDTLKDYNFESGIIQILNCGINLPPDQFKTKEIKELAERCLAFAIKDFSQNFESGYKGIEDLNRVPEFAAKFGIEQAEWQQVVSEVAESMVADEKWEAFEEFAKYFSYLGRDFKLKAHKKRFYGELDKIGLQTLENVLGFSKLELEKQDTVSVRELAQKIYEKKEILGNLIVKMPIVYRELKAVLSGSRPRQSVFDRVDAEPFVRLQIIPEFSREADSSYKVRVIYYLGDGDNISKQPRIEFHFSQNKKDASKNNGYLREYYTGTKSFKLNGVFLGDKAHKEVGLRGFGGGIPGGFYYEISNLNNFNHINREVRLKPIADLVREALLPERDLSQVFDEIRNLSLKNGITQQEAEDLCLAIKEFAKYNYSQTKSDIGDCLVVPHTFNGLCRLKFKLQMDTARYGESHPEWGSSGGYSPYTFFHEVSVFSKKIVVDWTITQYSEHTDKTVPYVYEVGNRENGLGPLYKSVGGKTPNDPYEGTELLSTDTIYYGI